MARPKEFDRGEVLEKAMMTFWEKGYAGTSVNDLVRSMGIGKASLYDTFGSKQEIWGEVMDLYAEKADCELFAPLRGQGSPRRILRDFFRGLVDRQSSEDSHSCLFAKTALMGCGEDVETAERVENSFQHIEDTFFDVLSRARAEGEIGPNKNVRALSRFFTSSMMGFSVLSSVQRDRRALQDVVRSILSVLD